MVDLFKEVIPSLLESRNVVITSDNENEYNAFMTNRAISQHIDCILYANEMNRFPYLDKKLQYDFYFNALPKKKRKFQKWVKADDSKDILNLMEYFDYSAKTAKECLRILSREQLDHIANILHKGGVVK